jgi:alpha-mannosidase
MRLDMPWSVVRPEIDQIPGACRNWFAVQRWVDLSNKDYGVTWATIDAPLIEAGAITANLIGSLSNPSAWMDHIEPSQTIYSWAMNNHWHTNYRAEQEGATTFRYAIWPHKTYRPEAATRFGIACSQPLIVTAAAGDAPSLPRLHVEAPGAIVTALKPSEDGKAWIVRLFGASGQDEKVLVSAGVATGTVWTSDASEKPLQLTTGPVTLPAWSLMTLRVTLPTTTAAR